MPPLVTNSTGFWHKLKGVMNEKSPDHCGFLLFRRRGKSEGKYRGAGRKDKIVMLDQFIKLTGCNRKYAVNAGAPVADLKIS